MARLEMTFSGLAARGEKALVAYVTVGDPDLETSYEVVSALCEGGADVLELGVPFSDPTADGPTIQRSSQRALAAGTTVAGILEVVKRLRAAGREQAVILFGYFNPFLQYGLERLARDARAAGVDGFLVVDLPPEEAGPFQRALAAEGLSMISLLTPTSDAGRVEAVKRIAGGFVYYVSRTGVTGAKVEGLGGVNAHVAALQAAIPLPVCVGFGISEPAQVAELGGQADGVVVGSAIVSMVERLGRGEATLSEIEAFTRSLKAPLVSQASPA
ncbi:MAG: tryptophan synthase subunit alpha [Candidatus Sericytochromatia bacterium]